MAEAPGGCSQQPEATEVILQDVYNLYNTTLYFDSDLMYSWIRLQFNHTLL